MAATPRKARATSVTSSTVVPPPTRLVRAGSHGRPARPFIAPPLERTTSKPDPHPHGLAPTDNLPCNHHDVCYQTCGATKVNCDDAMLKDMQAVCGSAYPE